VPHVGRMVFCLGDFDLGRPLSVSLQRRPPSVALSGRPRSVAALGGGCRDVAGPLQALRPVSHGRPPLGRRSSCRARTPHVMHTEEFASMSPTLTTSLRSCSVQGTLPSQEARQAFRNAFPLSATFRSTSARATPLSHTGTPSPWSMLRSDSPSRATPGLREATPSPWSMLRSDSPSRATPSLREAVLTPLVPLQTDSSLRTPSWHREAADLRPSSEPRLEARVPFRGGATPSSEVERAGSSFSGSVAGSAFQLASFRRNSYRSPASPEVPGDADTPSRRWWLESERRAGQISSRLRNAGGSSSSSDVSEEDLVPDRGRSAPNIVGDGGPFNVGNFRGVTSTAPRRRGHSNQKLSKEDLERHEAAVEQEFRLSTQHRDSSGTWLLAFLRHARSVPLQSLCAKIVGDDLGPGLAAFLQQEPSEYGLGAALDRADVPDGEYVFGPQRIRTLNGNEGWTVLADVAVSTPGNSSRASSDGESADGGWQHEEAIPELDMSDLAFTGRA